MAILSTIKIFQYAGIKCYEHNINVINYEGPKNYLKEQGFPNYVKEE